MKCLYKYYGYSVWTLRAAYGWATPKRRMSGQTVKVISSELPSNLVVLGVDRHKIEQRKVRCPNSPSNCEVARHANDCPAHRKPTLAWLDSFKDVNFVPEKAVELHPELFSDNPRIDFLHLCKEWQKSYREVDYAWEPTRADIGRGKRRPWPQKGMGKARHSSTIAPQWKGGGVAHGPRGPRSLYKDILPHVRLRALTSALTIKNFQQDLLIMEDLDMPSDREHLLKCFSHREMDQNSALIVFAEEDDIKESDGVSKATEEWARVNLLPLVGLNVWSILHHDKLLLTLNALEELEKKVVWHLHRYPWIGKPHNFYKDMPFDVKDMIEE